jgi:general secretion pathway protein F
VAVFVYRAVDRGGNVIDGVMEAADARAVVERLQRDAYFPLEIAAESPGRRFAWPGRGQSRVGRAQLPAFTHQLARLLQAGVPLDRALGILEEVAATPRLRAITRDLLRSVQGGASLSEALGKHHPQPFSRLYIALVRAGERAGALEPTLLRLARFLEQAQQFREALVSALIYPALLTAVGAASVGFLLAFVIPRFAQIFRDLGEALPLPTQILLGVSQALARGWWGLALGVLAVVVAARALLATGRGRAAWDRLVLRLPVVGRLALESDLCRFARVLGTLLAGGVPIIPALAAAEDTVVNSELARAVRGLTEEVRRGAGLSAPMARHPLFPPLARHLVRVGEETGRLDEMLLRLAEDLESQVRRTIQRLMALAEPAIILGVGLVVGFIVVAILLAIFSISDVPL